MEDKFNNSECLSRPLGLDEISSCFYCLAGYSVGHFGTAIPWDERAAQDWALSNSISEKLKYCNIFSNERRFSFLVKMNVYFLSQSKQTCFKEQDKR